MKTLQLSLLILLFFFFTPTFGQNHYFKEYAPYDETIPTPESFLGYKIGGQHTRHDQVVAYFEKLAELSNRVTIEEYGRTYENRKLLMLSISSIQNINNLPQIKEKHLTLVNPYKEIDSHADLPLFIHLGYNIHGNEPSGTEASILTAYTLVASKNEKIKKYLDSAIIFIDPTINPDGRDRHTQWVNSRKSKNLVADPLDFEHTESWPSGRTNHYWFDLNRDWLLAIHPESQAKLKWFHEWYPNIITDFHEMGTSNNTYFFEPERASGSEKPLTPKRNGELTTIFAKEFAKSLESVGTFYFTNELFDATYPGYGSSYGDLQGAIALLFEQTASRGHLKKLDIGNISFPFTIKNQYISSFSTIRTAVDNKDLLYDYQKVFFKNAIDGARKSAVKAYVFGDAYDENRTKAFIKFLFHHKIKVYKLEKDIKGNGQTFSKEKSYIVPTEQNQYKMIQNTFEIYNTYNDSIFYDASAWSIANFYNMPYAAIHKKITPDKEITQQYLSDNTIKIKKADYAYIIPWNDYYAPSFLYATQKAGIKSMFLSKPLNATINNETEEFANGSLVIPISLQSISKDSIYSVVKHNAEKFSTNIKPINVGENGIGINLGRRGVKTLQTPKTLLWVGNGVSQYEAGEIWHLLDTQINMPLSKIALRNFNRVKLNDYNTMIMVSGSYHQLDSIKIGKIKDWVAKGNTLITSRQASAWAIKNRLVNEELIEKEKDSLPKERLKYGDARENYGKNVIGGAIFKINLDITHPIGYGYTQKELPIYRNSSVFLKPSKNPYSTVAKYTEDPHIDGYISKESYELLSKSASIIVSPIGNGRVVMFADNPNFRAAWYGTNKLFLNAIFFGNHIKIPK
ncbi:MAG: M14 family zinc carboxypeptidase [Bacteroidota bacterium]